MLNAFRLFVCILLGGQSTDVSLLNLMSELIQMRPFPPNDVRKRLIEVCLPTLMHEEERENEQKEQEDVVQPVSNFLSSMLKTQKKEKVRLKLLRSLLFGSKSKSKGNSNGNGNGKERNLPEDETRLSHLIVSKENKVRKRALHVLSSLLNVHTTLSTKEDAEKETKNILSDIYALVLPRVADRHLRVQNIATTIIHGIVSRATAMPSFFKSTQGRMIGIVLESPSATQERLTCLRLM